MRTKEKHRVDMLKGVALVQCEGKVQRNLLTSPKPRANMGCALKQSLASRKPSMVWGFDDIGFHT